MNETGRRAPGTRSRIWGTAVAAAVLLSLSAPVLAKDHPGKGVDNASVPVAAAPQAVPDKKAQKELAKAQRQAIKAQQQAAKGERQAAKAQRQAAKAEQKAARRAARLTAPSPAGGSNPLPLRAATAAPQAAAAPAATRPVARSAARRAAAHRAAARRRAAAHRRAAARRAAARRAAARRRAAATPTAATTPIAATGATPASAPPTSRKKAAAPKRNATPKPAEQPSSGGGVVTRTVRDIVHVIPGWAKALILALAALLAVAALLIAAAALRNRRLRALSKRLLEEVGTLSTALLPVIPPRIGTLGVSVAYRPAEGLAAGGDFYDVFPLDRGRVGIVVGDVSGHGRESLGPATFTRHMVRSYLEAGLAPRAALQLAGKVVDEQDRDDFATVVAAVHDPSAGTFSYATAGHPPPIITGPGAHRPIMVASSPPLGAGGPTGLRQTTVPVAPGSTVCLITDGLIDARRGDKIFGLPRVERIVRELGQDATAERLVARVAREADSMPDDVAVAVMHVEGGAATASTLRVEEIEVARDELTGARLRRFLEACGLSSDQVAVIKDAQAKAAKYGAVVLRVRLAEGRSGVDILPVQQAAAPGGELAAIHSISSS